VLLSAGLINTFSGYGPLTVEWPGKDGKHPRCPPKGNVAKGKDELVGYLIFNYSRFLGWHGGEHGGEAASRATPWLYVETL